MTRFRGSILTLASAAMLALAACSSEQTTPTRSSTEPVPTQASSTDPAISVIDGLIIGGGDHLGYTVEVPDTWSSSDGAFVVKAGSGVLGLSVWDVGQIPRNPCHWRGHLYDPGPTVQDLVDALAVQPLRNATTPTAVTLGGYPGQYMKWSVPADMVVTGDAEFEGCDVEPSNGHRDFVSWHGNQLGARYQQVAGQVDRLWILDVDGQRVLVDATYSPDTTEADRDELGQIAESIRFAAPAA